MSDSDEKLAAFDDVLNVLVRDFESGQVQPPPGPSNVVGGWDLVIADLSGLAGAHRITGGSPGRTPMGAAMQQRLMLALCAARNDFGVRKYGTKLRPRNGRDFMSDYLQERLDGLAYLRCKIWEAENPEEGPVDPRGVEILKTIYDTDIVTFAVAVLHWAGEVIEQIQTPTIEA